MDNKFQRPNKAALTNAQYFSFMIAFQEQLQSAAFAAPAIQTRTAALDAQILLVDKYLKIQQGSYLSEGIYSNDHRGDLAYGAAHSVVLAWLGKEFEPQATAAEMLNRVFKLYKINTSAQYDEQWGLIGNFLTDIQKPELAEHIQTLGIGAPLQVLQECYTQMRNLIRERDDETNGKVKGALVQTRKDCDKAYNAVLDVIEAATLMVDDAAPYYEFITRWNTALNRYIQQIISKKGGSSSGGSSSGGSSSGGSSSGGSSSGGSSSGGDTPTPDSGNGDNNGGGSTPQPDDNAGFGGGDNQGGGSTPQPDDNAGFGGGDNNGGGSDSGNGDSQGGGSTPQPDDSAGFGG